MTASFQTLSERLSHSYTTAYKHLDDYRPIGQYKPLNTCTFNHSEDGSYQRAIICDVEPNSDISELTIQRALEDEFSFSCTHDHECTCGFSQAVDATKLNGSLWCVIVLVALDI